MASEVFISKMTDFMEEGTIVAWLVAEGDHVDEGQPILELETDKATVGAGGAGERLPRGHPRGRRARGRHPGRRDDRLHRGRPGRDGDAAATAGAADLSMDHRPRRGRHRGRERHRSRHLGTPPGRRPGRGPPGHGPAAWRTSPASWSRRARRAVGVQVDVTDGSSVRAAFDRVESELGPPWVLVNSAGVLSYGATVDMPESDWDRVHRPWTSRVSSCARRRPCGACCRVVADASSTSRRSPAASPGPRRSPTARPRRGPTTSRAAWPSRSQVRASPSTPSRPA